MKVCTQCKQELPLNAFYRDKRVKDGRHSACKKCEIAYKAAHRESKNKTMRRFRNRRYAYIHTKKTHCEKCGNDKHYVLQFHHIDPSTKLFNIGECTQSYTKIDAELEKCVCLCSNCHDTFHYFYGQTPENPVEDLTAFLSKDWVEPIRPLVMSKIDVTETEMVR